MVGENNIWDQPWTGDQIRQHSDQWSLAADAGLYLRLQSISQGLLSQTHAVETRVEDLNVRTKASASRVDDVIGEFLRLSNTQFVENRVYEASQDSVQEQSDGASRKVKTKEEQEAELIENISQGLQLALTAARNHQRPSGYSERHLPCIIGSEAFHSATFGAPGCENVLIRTDLNQESAPLNQDEITNHVLPEGIDGYIKVEHGLSSPSEDLFDSISDGEEVIVDDDDIKSNPSEPVSVTSVPRGPPTAAVRQTLAVTFDDEPEHEIQESPPAERNLFPEDKGLFADDGEDGEADLFSGLDDRLSRWPKKDNNDLFSGLFDNGPPTFSDSVSSSEPRPSPPPAAPISPTKKLPAGAVSLFAGGVNPFASSLLSPKQDSSEEESSEVSNEDSSRSRSTYPHVSSTNALAAPLSPSGSLSSTSTQGLFSEEPDATEPTSSNRLGAKNVLSLFSDDNDDGGGDDLFAAILPKSVAPPQPVVTNPGPRPRVVNLFDDFDSSPNLIEEKPKPSTLSKLNNAEKPKGFSLFRDDDDEEEENVKSPSSSVFRSAAPPSLKQPLSKPTSLLFPEDEDDNIFGDALIAAPQPKPTSPPANVQPSPAPAVPKIPTGGMLLPGFVSIGAAAVTPAPAVQPKPSTINSLGFDSSIINVETLPTLNRERARIPAKRRLPSRRGRQQRPLSPSVSAPESEFPTVANSPPKPSVLSSPPTEEDDLFPGETHSTVSPPSLFGEQNPQPTTTAVAAAQLPPPSKPRMPSLDDIFGDTGNDDDDIFKVSGVKLSIQTKKVAEKSIFDDADDDDDIFSTVSTPRAPTVTRSQTTKPEKKKPKREDVTDDPLGFGNL